MNLIVLIIFFSIFFKVYSDECTTFDNDYFCEGDVRSFSEEMDNDAFQTPPRNDIYGRYKKTYQDMHYLVGYARQEYSQDKKSCTLTFITMVNPVLGEEGTDYKIKYIFGDIEQESNSIELNSEENSYPKGMPILARIINLKTNKEMVKLELEDEYFIWDNLEINLPDEYENGQKGSIVELFGWPYEDIAQECEFLGKAGYLGVKIFSPNEQLLTDQLSEGSNLNPWWYGTQSVSFKLNSRYGNKKQLKEMINTCRSFNVRIYAETVINHMTGGGNDMYDDHVNSNCDHWGPKGGSGGSPFWTISSRAENNPITNKKPVIEYPAVPYFPSHFHCAFDMDSEEDPDQLNHGWAFSLADVNTEKNYVRQRIADYYIELLSIGISGISIPNALYIYPDSMIAILSKLKKNLGGVFPDDFIAILIPENIDIESKFCDDDTYEFNLGIPFTEKLKTANFSETDIKKIKFWFKGFHSENYVFLPQCYDEWQIDEERQVISLEFSDDINMNNNYNIYIRDKNINTHREDTISLFTNEKYDYNWKIRNIFSSFSLYNNLNGIPDGKSDCSYCANESCKNGCVSFPYRKAYNPISTGYDCGNADNWVEGEYTRVHRDQLIINAMRKWMFPEKPEKTEDELYDGERLKANCNEKCLICNDESKKDDLCLICNKTKGYYPVIYPGTKQTFYECYKSTLKYDRLYFDKKDKAFKPCYETCKQCEKDGNPENHNCKSCDSNLIEKPGSSSDTFNCVTNCANSYYFTASGQYKCTETAICPAQASIYIKEKNKCIDNCKNDADYKYLYNGNCVEECPENTIQDNQNFLCKEKAQENDCTLSAKTITLEDFYDYDIINSIVKSYRDEYFYTNMHTLKYVNSGYNLFIYKNINCINMISLEILTIDPNSCINKVKEENNINEDLIIVYFEKTKVKIAGYLLYNPITGQKLNFEEICTESEIRNVDEFKYIILKFGENNEPTKCPEGLYPVALAGKPISYKNCKDKSLTYEKIYFDPIEEVFFPCFEFCRTCTKEGKADNQNCLSCEEGYMIHPHSSGIIFNCIQQCRYSYYFTNTGIYLCTSTPQCPIDYNKFIEEKNQCIDDCKNDDTYKYLYNGNCLSKCPEGTIHDEGDFLCKIPYIDKCTLSIKEAWIKNTKDDGGIDSLVASYKNEFNYTNKHVSEFNNSDYEILIYKDKSCLDELGVKFPNINFGECEEKVKAQNNIKDDLIVVLLEKKYKNAPSDSSYSLYNPLSGVKLDAKTICENDEIIVEENVLDILNDYKFKIDPKFLVYLTDQNIDIFNASGAFYTDICYEFKSPYNKDITLEDRLISFYPNVSLCDSGCISKGVNLSTMKTICNCKFNDISNNDLFGDINDLSGVGEILEIINNSNLQVFKCIKYLFRRFKTSIGGYIIIFALLISIGFTLLFFLRDMDIIGKYMVNKTNSYLDYISKLSTIEDDKKIEKIKNDFSKNKIIIDINNEKNIDLKKGIIKNGEINKADLIEIKQDSILQGKDLLSVNKINNSKEILSHSLKDNDSKNQIISFNDKNKAEKKGKEELNEKEDFAKYLEPDIDDQEFEDIILSDKRFFQEYFFDSLSDKQIFINTFYNYDPFRPLSLKIILLILNLIMYMVINGIFYGEEAVSEIYHIEGDDPFFGFFPRSLTRFVYSAIVGVIIGFIIDFFFIKEKKMKNIFIREKNNIVNMRCEISRLNKRIKYRSMNFVIFTFLILILFGIYLLCFNYVYPYTQYEWIKSSITLIIIMQILSTLTALAETILRFLSFRFKSERIFKVSKLLD